MKKLFCLIALLLCLTACGNQVDLMPNASPETSVLCLTVYDGDTITGYELVCDSIHGYCVETVYTTQDNSPSFSTDHWRDEIFYYHENVPYIRPIVGEDRYKYEYYHGNGYYPYEGRTDIGHGYIIIPGGEQEGKTAAQKLAEILGT